MLTVLAALGEIIHDEDQTQTLLADRIVRCSRYGTGLKEQFDASVIRQHEAQKATRVISAYEAVNPST